MKKFIKKTKFSFKFKSRKGISLLLVLLISGVMMTTTLVASDVMLRVGKVIRSISASQKTYFAVESGTEETLYEINKNHTAIASLPSSGTVGGITWNLENTLIDEMNPCIPNSLCNYTGQPITNPKPLEVGLDPDESFQINLDIEGGDYPNNIRFSTVSGSGQLIVFKEVKATGSMIQYSGNIGASTTTWDIDPNVYRYKFRIFNSAATKSEFEIHPLGGDLTVGVAVTISANYGATKRIVTATSTRWQIYGQ